jgi:cytochrome c biogenesis protein CcmG, thiol:disulfide interchange protein DsbE
VSKPKVKWPILAIGVAIVAPLVMVLASGFGNDPHYIPTATVGKPAAPFVAQDLNGNTVSSEELRGKVVVLNFWSTWCGPCKFEHPVLQREPQRYPDVVFLGALYDDDPEMARRFLASAPGGRPQALPYPTVADPDGRMAIDYGVSGVPETYFINRDGRIVHKHVAPIDPRTLQACIELARVSGEVSPQMLAACDPEKAR